MKRQLISTLAALLLVSSPNLFAQGNFGGGGGQVPGAGGSYTGPEDTVPTAPTGGGGGNTGGGGSTVQPGGGSNGPAASNPGGFPIGGGSGAAGGPGVALPTDLPPGTSDAVDWTRWQLWWHYNQHAYLSLEDHLFENAVLTGSDDFFLGHGEQDGPGGALRPTPSSMQAEVLPMLREFLQKGAANQMEAESLLAIGKVGAFTGDKEVALAALKPFITHANQAVRERAVAAIGILGREQSIDLVARLAAGDAAGLRNEYWITFGDKVPYRTRAYATYSLGLIGATVPDYHRIQIVRALTGREFERALGMPTPDVAAAAVLALGLVPLPYDSADTDGAGKRTVVLATRQHQLRWLLAVLDDAKAPVRVRAHVPGVLGRLLEGTPGDSALRRATVKRLIGLLQARGSGRELRQGAITALGMIVDSDEDPLDEDARKALQHAAEHDPDQVARRFAMIAYAEAASRAGTGKGDPIDGVRTARRFYTRNLTRGTSQTRPWTGIGLGILERSLQDQGIATSEESAEALRNALNRARSPSEAGALALACGLARDLGAQESLSKLLASGAERPTRSYAALALGMIGAQSSRQELAEVLAQSTFHAEMLHASAIALTLLDDATVVPQLLALLENASSLASQAPISTALGIVGDARAIAPLTAEAANVDRTAISRAVSLTALGRLAERHELRWNARLAQRVNYSANPLTLTSPDLGGGILDLP